MMKNLLKTIGRAVRRCLGQPANEVWTERLYDQDGRLLWDKPYYFRCLFAEGQEMIAESVPMTILSCRLDGTVVTTRVRLHKPWPHDSVLT